jgi:hypothetical protein
MLLPRNAAAAAPARCGVARDIALIEAARNTFNALARQ